MNGERYHQLTKHSWRSVRSGGHRLDWSNQPLPFKLYPGVEPIPLPRELPESGIDSGAALFRAGRQVGAPLDLPRLAHLLFYSAGVTRTRRAGGGWLFFRAAPSAGAPYPVEVYVVCADMSGLSAGVYHFGPIDFALRRLRSGDFRGAVANAVGDGDVGRRPVVAVFTGIPWRTTWKYGERGYRHLFWDAGTILANLLAACDATGVPARVIGGFVDRDLAELVDVERPEEFPLAVVALGGRPDGPAAAPRESPRPLRLSVTPLSKAPIRYPLLEEAHVSGDLERPDEVAAWRAAGRRLRIATTVSEVQESADTSGTLEEAILARGSARRFSRTPIDERTLRWILAVGGRPLDADFLAPGTSLLAQFLVVHAVEGLEPAVYRWDASELRLIHRDASRATSAYLCLEQALGGESAVTVFSVSPLRPVLDALGQRGYRMAQLEAGIVSGRVHLAAYAAGLGATGLTFYDDDVRAHLRTDAEPMLATAAGRLAYRPRRGRRPSEMSAVRLTKMDR